MAEYKLALAKRTVTGKKLKSLRAEDQIPSVVYGDAGMEPILTASDYNTTEKVLRSAGYHSPIDLEIAGQPQLAIAKAVDIDPVSRRILNVEFRAISADAIVEATTPIRVINFDASDAAKLHLVYLQVMEEVEVKAKPADLPKEITVDATQLAKVDDRLTVGDLQLPEGVELVDKDLDKNTPIANVYDPAAEAAAREAADKKAAEEAAAASAESAESTEEPAAESTSDDKSEESKAE